MRIGLLGVGRMGLPILRRLVSNGHTILAADPDATRRVLARSAGAETSAGIRLAASVDVLITVLPGPIELEQAMVAEGILGAVPPGRLWIDATTTDPRVCTRLADAAASRGVEMVGAAIAGGVADAGAGTLGFFVGGSPSAIERARPLLAELGDDARIELAGDRPADGPAAKLLANLLWFGQAVAVTEALLLGRSLGFAPGRLRGILERSAGGSAFLSGAAGSLLDGDDLDTFGIDRVVEELDTLTALADESGVPFELSRAVARLHREALERFGPVEGELLAARLLEERAGRPLGDRG